MSDQRTTVVRTVPVTVPEAKVPLVSVVIPVKNPGLILERCLLSLRRLDYPQERLEIVLSDGGEDERTAEFARRFGAKLVPNALQTVGPGRNRGFEACSGDYVLFTDADCELEAAFLSNALPAFIADSTLGGVGGNSLPPEDASSFERAVNNIFLLAEASSATAQVQKLQTAQVVKDLPGCNALYRRAALEKVMPIDESLLTAEDVEMNFRLRDAGFRLLASPHLALKHSRRSSARGFIRQMYRFAIGRVQVARKYPEAISPWHRLLGWFLVGAGVAFVLAIGLGVVPHLMVLAGVAVLFLFGYGGVESRSISVAALTPAVGLLFAVAWSLGYLRERFLPMRNVVGR